MKRLFSFVAMLSLLFFAGCSIFNGLHVRIRAESAEVMKKEVLAFLIARGFQPEGHHEGFTTVYAVHPRTGEALREGLVAIFDSDGKEFWFHIGKSGSTRFAPGEIALVDECAEFLASHSDLIVSGSASKTSTSENARSKFYAKIKKD